MRISFVLNENNLKYMILVNNNRRIQSIIL